MKKLFISIIAIAAIAMTSCKKEAPIEPEQKVTYSVACDYCLVYVEDDIWNADNDQDRSKSQHFNVRGQWKYQWTNASRDSINMRIVVGVFSPRQNIKATITTTDGRSVTFNGALGFDPRITDPQDGETVLTLKLK